MKIEVYKPKYRVEECICELRECLVKSWTGMGYKTTEFEEMWKEYTGLNNALFLNSGSSALFLAVNALKLRNNWNYRSEVISTPITWIASNYAITKNNLKVSFADVDDSLNLDPDSVKKKINPHTKAIMFVGMGGNPKNLDKIAVIAKKNGLKLILDGCHMVGSKFNKEHVGKESDAAIFSFHPTKNLPTADGGMLCMKSAEDHKLVKELSFYGFNEDKSSIEIPGFKYNSTSLNAALGIVGLKYLDFDNERREDIALKYEKNLGDYSIKHNCISSRHLYQIVVENRDLIREKLHNLGINTGIHFESSTKYPPFNMYPTPTKADYYSKRILSIPLHLHLTDSELVFISDTVRQVIRNVNGC